MDDESQKTGMNYTLLATPAEGLSGRFVRMDRERFGCMRALPTASTIPTRFHIPVYHPISAVKKIRLEAPYHELTNAGHITYVRAGRRPAAEPRGV